MIIYKSENRINGDIYIGKTIMPLNKRIKGHFRDSQNHNYHFANALNKYGVDNFDWSILCETDIESKLNALEKFYIACYRKMAVLYNLTDGGEGVSGYKHTEESNQKNRKAHLGLKASDDTRKKMSESRFGLNNPMYGKTHTEEIKQKMRSRILSEETKKKISESLKGNKLSEETKMKISIKLKGKKKPQRTQEHIKKLSESHKGKPSPNKGKKFSEEHRKHLSESHKKRGFSNER